MDEEKYIGGIMPDKKPDTKLEESKMQSANFPFQETNNHIKATCKDGVWEVIFVAESRISKDGEKYQICVFAVKSYDKILPKAIITCQKSADIYFSTHTPEELYKDEDQTLDTETQSS
jgi:hypothetical protein